VWHSRLRLCLRSQHTGEGACAAELRMVDWENWNGCSTLPPEPCRSGKGFLPALQPEPPLFVGCAAHQFVYRLTARGMILVAQKYERLGHIVLA
jgi:hypothetical protein